MSDDLEALAGDLAEFDVEDKPIKRSPIEERVIAGFEDIQRFTEREGHPPRHGEDKDIFERLYAVRLERLASSADYRTILAPLDYQELLHRTGAPDDDLDLDLDALATDLEDMDDVTGDLTELRHVRPVAEKRAAEEIANRETCADFDKFRPVSYTHLTLPTIQL